MEMDFEASELDTFENVFGLTPKDPLNNFAEIWYQVFLLTFFSSLPVHVAATIVAITRLRKHVLGRFFPVIVFIVGMLSTLAGAVINSAAIAGVYRASDFVMTPLHSLVWGVGQTIIITFVSFSRILATL